MGDGVRNLLNDSYFDVLNIETCFLYNFESQDDIFFPYRKGSQSIIGLYLDSSGVAYVRSLYIQRFHWHNLSNVALECMTALGSICYLHMSLLPAHGNLWFSDGVEMEFYTKISSTVYTIVASRRFVTDARRRDK